MIKNVVVVTIALYLFCGVASGEQRSDKTVLQVEWSRGVQYPINTNVNSISDFDQLLERMWDDTLSVTLKDGNVLKERTIHNCTELLNTYNKEKNAIQGDRQYVQAWRVTCDAVKRIPALRPAKISFLDEISFSNFNVKPLLQQLAKVRIPSDYGPYKLYFESLNNTQSVDCKKVTSCRVLTDEETFVFIPLATGDFNRDGVQDFLLQVNSSSRAGGGNMSIGVVLTKTSLDGELRILDWW